MSQVGKTSRSSRESSVLQANRQATQLSQLVESGLNKTNYTHLFSQRNIRILNLACGRADETGVLLKLFGGESLGCELLGIDIRAREIQEAQQRWNKWSSKQANFLVHNGTKINEIAAVREKFDIAFMRHQNFWNGDTTWFKIYDQALHALKENGVLIITSYFDKEHMLAIEALTRLGAKLNLTMRNQNSEMIQRKYQKSSDRHIAIFSL